MKIPALLVLAAASALTLSACGGGSSSTGVASDTGAAAAGQGLHVGTTSLGKVLVDSKGMTLYVLSADSKNKSTCDAQCLSFWPPVAPTGAGKLAVAAGQTKTTAGSGIATVAGQPVYTFVQDQNPGDVNGEGVNLYGGIWYALTPSGKAIVQEADSQPSSPTTDASVPAGAGPYGGGGY
jgi:predicted lipoprotein with Yx(FWY)xxD motif